MTPNFTNVSQFNFIQFLSTFISEYSEILKNKVMLS